MTQEVREHIAYTIGIMEMAAGYFKSNGMASIAAAIEAQCEVLQQLLDEEREGERNDA